MMLTTFRYCTIKWFRARTGITEAQADNDTVRGALERAATIINLATAQFFLPIVSTEKIDGSGDDTIAHPKLVPVLQINRVSIDYNKTLRLQPTLEQVFDRIPVEGEVLERDDFELTANNRLIRYLGTVFPRGASNVEIVGIFGWLEPRKEIETATTTEIDDTSTTVDVADASGFDVRDVLLFGDLDGAASDLLIWVEIEAVDYDTKQITFEVLGKLRGLPIVSGSKVTCFGKVPESVALAAAIVAKNKELIITGSGSSDLPEGVKSMRTDRFAWTRFTPSEGGAVTGGTLTGDSYADSLLQHYVAPPYVGAV